LGYLEIIKQGIKTGNRNLMVLVTQFLAGIVMLIVFLVLSAMLAVSAIGSLANFDTNNLSPDTLFNLFKSSASLVAMIVVFGLVFVAIAAVITSYVHAGNLGNIIDTARGKVEHFKFSEFFSSGNRSVLSMLALYIVWLSIVIGTFLVFGAFAGVGVYAVLIPLKEAGRTFVAFGLGVPFFLVLILAAILCFFMLFAVWTFSSIMLVGERLGAFASIGAAYRFIRKNFWDFFLFALIMFALVFAANLLTNVFSMPFSMKAETNPVGAIALFPLLLVGVALQMYVGLLARACFAEYYVIRTAPPAPVTAPAPVIPPAEDAQLPIEGELLPEPPEETPGPGTAPPAV